MTQPEGQSESHYDQPHEPNLNEDGTDGTDGGERTQYLPPVGSGDRHGAAPDTVQWSREGSGQDDAGQQWQTGRQWQPQAGERQFGEQGQQQYGQQPYSQPQYGEYSQQPYGQQPYGQQPYAQPQHGQYAQPPYGQFGQQQYVQPQYGQPHFEQYSQQQYGYPPSTAEPERRKSRTGVWILLAAVIVAAALVAAAFIVKPNWLGFKKVLDNTAVASTIVSQSNGQYRSVTCPSGEPATTGTTFQCTSGNGGRIDVKVTSNSGDYVWSPAG